MRTKPRPLAQTARRQMASVMAADALASGACAVDDLARAGFSDAEIARHARKASSLAGAAMRRRGLDPRLDMTP